MLRDVSSKVTFKVQETSLTCKHSSNSEHQLLQSGDSASDGWMRDFGLVHWYNHDQETNAKPSDGSSSIEEVQILSCCLQRTAKAEDDGANHNGESPAEPVAHGSCESCAKESATSEQGHYSTAFFLVSSFGSAW